MTDIQSDRYNEGKLRLDLILPEWITLIGYGNDSKQHIHHLPISVALTKIMNADVFRIDDRIQEAIFCIVHVMKNEYKMTLDEIVEDVTAVMEIGERKYSAWNWARGMKFSTIMGCANRHWYKAVMLGHEIDDESCCRHLSHCLINVLFLHYYRYTTGNEFNDLLGAKDGS